MKVNVGGATKVIQTVVRFGLTLYMLYRSYTETGIWTAAILFLLTVANEARPMLAERERGE